MMEMNKTTRKAHRLIRREHVRDGSIDSDNRACDSPIRFHRHAAFSEEVTLDDCCDVGI